MTTPSASELLVHFSVPPLSYQLQPIKEGLINETYLVLAEHSPHFILQRINTAVFRDPEAVMDNLQRTLGLLQSGTYRSIQLVPAKTGDSFHRTEAGVCWRLMTYIPDSVTYNTTRDPSIAWEAGRIIAAFHNLMRPAVPAEFKETIPEFHNLEVRVKQYLDAKVTALPERLREAREAISLADYSLKLRFPFQEASLPLRVCHNDTKLNNILFSKKTNAALCLIDLDTLMKGYFFYDFGDAVRTIVNTAPEDERMLEKISFSKPLFEAFLDGLFSKPELLTREEMDTLPYGAVYMPLLHGLRALTDFLSGDVYYQVSYKRQNLDRSLSLLTFADKARQELDYMRNAIRKKLPYS